MAQLTSEKTKQQIRPFLEQITTPVKLVFFTQEHACGSCREQHELLESLAALSDKLRLEVYDLVADAELARRYGIDKVPATVVVGEKDYGKAALTAQHYLSSSSAYFHPETQRIR